MDKLKVLVVDDESRMRKLVKDFLVREDYEVIEAGRSHIIDLTVNQFRPFALRKMVNIVYGIKSFLW